MTIHFVHLLYFFIVAPLSVTDNPAIKKTLRKRSVHEARVAKMRKTMMTRKTPMTV